MKRASQWLCFVWLVLLFNATSITAAAETSFYRGKTLTVLINYATGGPTDIEGRLVPKHLPKHIPGPPFIIVNNMPGAGGVTANNYLGEVAKPDGLTMAYFTGNFFNILLPDSTLRVGLSKFAYIASIEGASIADIRKDVAPGTPPEAVTALRQGFRAMLTDEEFVAEFKKVTRSNPNYRVGVSGDKIVRRLQEAPPQVKAFIKKHTVAKS